MVSALWGDLDLLFNRYGWPLSEVKALAVSVFADAITAARMGAEEQGREALVAAVFPVWLEHVDGGKVPFAQFCEKLGLIEKEGGHVEPAVVRKQRAAEAIARAEKIRKADKGRIK